MTLELDAPHVDLTFLTALSEERAERLVAFLAAGLDGTVADIGCGWAELLLRTLEAAPGANGIGVDLDAASIAHGVELAAKRGLADRVELVAGDAKKALPPRADAVICIGASQIWGPPVEEDQPLDHRSALRALRALLEPGGRAVYGEGIWSTTPTEAAIAPLAGRLDEFVKLGDLLEIAVEEGFMPVQVHEANQDEFDEFESGYSACYARWLATHPADHPDAAGVREQAAAQRAAYYGGYRGVLGLAYLALVAV
ncbi:MULTISPECIES: SAM-dependent methyltransferase [unclassified Nocardioides]|uniref:SAM-dependent methyltransferase n=1 Tax=unclassified Nocardioides TaxID=2615069 RepID=UPI00071358E9|nr:MULTISPECIES: class I SAM-dependent methyltransferase [unclassified Nocardioides]KQY63998.1 hypothetical protein ASD30_03235 [Nocardioides sp. Root140]KQZ69918.1 hypothetical protein ASD66_09480 [Nocardioides sp. Root151]